jgi:isochorismate synthase
MPLPPSSENLQLFRLTDLLPALLGFAYRQHYSFALWRLPGDPQQRVLISKKTLQINREESLEDLRAGFVFAPFERIKDSIFLEADYLFTFSEGILAEAKGVSEEAGRELLNEVKPMSGSAGNAYFVRNVVPVAIEKHAFIELVTHAVQEIERGKAEKLVPSRTREIDRPEDFEIIQAFDRLCKQFPNAMVSFVSTPESGSWMGATPELLVCVKDSVFQTVALAGTQPYDEGTSVKNVAWTQKEIEEQALVERYIISCFKKIRLREYDEHGPKTVIAGNLMHLRSDFTVDMKETNFPQLGSVMLQLLHPTSAVCGMPLEEAKAFLDANEKYDRAFYSGYLGPVNIDDQIHIFVNLRCMQLTDKKIILYAGAGVTADSIAEKEWEETEMKMNSLLRVLIPAGK